MSAKQGVLALAAALLLLLACGCAGEQASAQSTAQLRALKPVEGTVVVTQHAGLYDGYEYFGAFTGDWALCTARARQATGQRAVSTSPYTRPVRM